MLFKFVYKVKSIFVHSSGLNIFLKQTDQESSFKICDVNGFF